MWSDREVERWFDYFVDRAEERIYKLLQRAGEEFVKLARKKGNYQDHTGNLRSSIGYVIVKDGDILTENYELSDKKGTDKYTGLREAKRLVSELLPLYKNDEWSIANWGTKWNAFNQNFEEPNVLWFDTAWEGVPLGQRMT